MGNNQIKSDLLGIPFGTAQAKLRKKILFHLAGRLAMLDCYRCQKPIESEQDFSVEHKVSWRFSKTPVETFYDVENIAFSHLSCNVSAVKDGVAKRTHCSKGHIFTGNVHHITNRSGLSQRCKECHAAAQRRYRREGRDKYRPTPP